MRPDEASVGHRRCRCCCAGRSWPASGPAWAATKGRVASAWLRRPSCSCRPRPKRGSSA
jgi:hypothetical protein